ncbi:MAG: hypothetical protein QOI80_1367, partial [Solirubrobacteraceae bacterium]|nr:hypothetical protein [Solirubrobacteraceae bacterium]
MAVAVDLDAPRLDWRGALRPRRIALAATAAAAAVAVVVLASGSAQPFLDALDRGLRAQPGWLALA